MQNGSWPRDWSCRVALTAWMLVLLCGPAPAENYAFLVAVRQYDRTQLNPLRFTENDITGLAETLRRTGYTTENVVLMTQTRGAEEARFAPFSKNIRQELQLVLDELSAEDTVLVAFSGHGVQFRGDAESYFCPSDANLDDLTTLVSLGEVYRALDQCQAGAKVLFVDACRNDPQSKLRKAAGEVELEPAGRPQDYVPPGGIAALFSCSAGQYSYEHPDLEHGVFFHYVIEGLGGKADLDQDGEVDLPELEKFAASSVMRYVRTELGKSQTPERRGEARGLVTLATLNSGAREREMTPDSQPGPASGASSGQEPRAVAYQPGCWVRIVKTPAELRSGSVALGSLMRGEEYRVLNTNTGYLMLETTTAGHTRRGWVSRDAVELAVPAATATITNTLGMQLTYLPPGMFMMGSAEGEQGRQEVEQQHQIALSQGFYLGLHEVTRGQFAKFVADSRHQTDAERDTKGGMGFNSATGEFDSSRKYNWRSVGWTQTDDHPVVNVTTSDAYAFCQWLGREEQTTYRLPTEGEWEYACRAGTTTAFYHGDNPEDLATVGNVTDVSAKRQFSFLTAIRANDGYVFTSPVGRFQPNGFGLFDMHGNVWEWCLKWDASNDQRFLAPGQVAADASDAHVLRGGAFNSGTNSERSAYRKGALANSRQANVGFRVLRIYP